MKVWLLIEAETGSGDINEASAFTTREAAVEEALDRADECGYSHRRAELKHRLQKFGCYTDGAVMTSIIEAVLHGI
jgi:hypothetical protein